MIDINYAQYSHGICCEHAHSSLNVGSNQVEGRATDEVGSKHGASRTHMANDAGGPMSASCMRQTRPVDFQPKNKIRVDRPSSVN